MTRVSKLWLSSAAALALSVTPRPAHAVPTQTVVFINSNQDVYDGLPQLALFAYYYGRSGVSLLGIYAGPRWTFGDFGVEFKTGAYGGNDIATRPILNNQLDYSRKHFSVTSFTDWYPSDEIYSYLSTFLIFGPLYVGGVGDFSAAWGAERFKVVSGGPTIGLGTKSLYLGTTYVFSTGHSGAIRLTLGVTL